MAKLNEQVDSDVVIMRLSWGRNDVRGCRMMATSAEGKGEAVGDGKKDR